MWRALPHSHLEIDITGRCNELLRDGCMALTAATLGHSRPGMLVLVVDQTGLRAKRRCRQQRVESSVLLKKKKEIQKKKGNTDSSVLSTAAC